MAVERPRLTVIVAATGGPERTRQVLSDLAEQRGVTPAPELIVVDGTGELLQDDLTASFPTGGTLLSVVGADVSVLRAAGARAARGVLLAFTEDLCRLPRDWCALVLATHASGKHVFGGAIENGTYRSPADWAAYFVEFGAFMPPLAGVATDALPGMNVVYERELIEDLVLESLCEPIVNGRLRDRGVQLVQQPDLLVRFEYRWGVIAFARHCFRSGRTFARLRLTGASALRRTMYAVGSATALPLLLCVRTGRHAFARKRYRLQLVQALPWVLMYSAGWALGEAVGALGSRERKTHEAHAKAQPT